MKKISLSSVQEYVENNIDNFHEKRIQSLKALKLTQVLKRKNPYLFKAKHVLTAEQLIKGITDAHISSNEETIFGDWLEGLAIFIANKVHGGYKSGIRGIDLEFVKDYTRYIITIKSGPNWGNSSQIEKMVSDFKTAKKILRTSNSGMNITAINGCCYGKDDLPDKGEYFKYCGQTFWEFISNSENLYTEIVEPIGYKSKERNDSFLISYAQMINKFTRDFTIDFCDAAGNIEWEKLVKFNSGTY